MEKQKSSITQTSGRKTKRSAQNETRGAWQVASSDNTPEISKDFVTSCSIEKIDNDEKRSSIIVDLE